jgi:hypothetical protein
MRKIHGAPLVMCATARGFPALCSGDLQAERALTRGGYDVISHVTRAAQDGGHSKERVRGSTYGIHGGAGGPLLLPLFSNLARI